MTRSDATEPGHILGSLYKLLAWLCPVYDGEVSPVTLDVWEVQLTLVFIEARQAVIQLLLQLS